MMGIPINIYLRRVAALPGYELDEPALVMNEQHLGTFSLCCTAVICSLRQYCVYSSWDALYYTCDVPAVPSRHGWAGIISM